MGSHEDTVRTLEAELALVERAFRGLTDEQWATPTKLRPLDESKPRTSWPPPSPRRSRGRGRWPRTRSAPATTP